MNTSTLEPGTQVKTANGHTGIIHDIDTATYSIPFYFIDITDGRFKGERIYVSAGDISLLTVE